jgi:hypothetical protein
MPGLKFLFFSRVGGGLVFALLFTGKSTGQLQGLHFKPLLRRRVILSKPTSVSHCMLTTLVNPGQP